MTVVSLHLLIITLNVNGLHSPKDIERTNGFFEKDSVIYCLQGSHFRFKDIHRLKVKKWKEIFYVDSNQIKKKKKAEMATLIKTE